MLGKYLVDVIQFGARPSPIIRLFSQPLGPNLHAAATGFAAAGPVGPLAELAVWGAGNDAGFFYVTWAEGNGTRSKVLSALLRLSRTIRAHLEGPLLTWQQRAKAEMPASLGTQIKLCREMTHLHHGCVKITAKWLPYDLLRIRAHHVSTFLTLWQLLFNWQ